MQLGKLLGLQWGGIDWNGKFIEVKRSYKTGRMGPTKTGRVRRVDMSDGLVETLRSCYIAKMKEALQEGSGRLAEFPVHAQGQAYRTKLHTTDF